MNIIIAIVINSIVLSKIWLSDTKHIEKSSLKSDETSNKNRTISVRKMMIERLLEEPIAAPETNIMQTKLEAEGGIQLIGWKWHKNLLRSLWMFSLFFLVASLIKVGYHYSLFLTTTVPESWCVPYLQSEDIPL